MFNTIAQTRHKGGNIVPPNPSGCVLTPRSARSPSFHPGCNSTEGEKSHEFFNKMAPLTFIITEIVLYAFSDLFLRHSALKISRMRSRPSQKGSEKLGQARMW